MHSKATQKQKTRTQSFTSQNANEASGCACIPHSLNAYTTCGGRPNEEANPCPQWLQPACALRYPNPHATSLRGRRMSPRGAAPPPGFGSLIDHGGMPCVCNTPIAALNNRSQGRSDQRQGLVCAEKQPEKPQHFLGARRRGKDYHAPRTADAQSTQVA